MLIRYISYIDVNYCLVNNKLLLLFRKIVIKMMDNHVLSFVLIYGGSLNVITVEFLQLRIDNFLFLMRLLHRKFLINIQGNL